jgi:SOS response regulatory protein OraA/RecX
VNFAGLEFTTRFLKAKERSEAELRAHLTELGVSEDDTEELVVWAKSKRFVDDQRIIEREVEIASTSVLRGDALVAERLARRGIVVELELPFEVPEFDRAHHLARSRRDEDLPKLSRFLTGRGFSPDTVERVIDAVQADLTEPRR